MRSSKISIVEILNQMAEQNVARVSVVMCTYNGTLFLEKQLHSIASQMLQPIELIICDDASQDETVKLLHHFKQQASFPVQIVVNEQNIGSTKNFEKALQLASGEFLALCDQDDIWLPEKLSTLAHILQENPDVGGVFSDAILFTQEDEPSTWKSIKPPTQTTLWKLHRFHQHKRDLFEHGGAIKLLLQHDIVTGATFMVRRSLQHYWHPIPASWVHDGWIAWMLALHSKLALAPQPLIKYRIHSQQQVGVGGGSRFSRLAQMKKTERARYAKVGNQYEELRARMLELAPLNTEMDQALQQKIEFMRRRSRLPHSLISRLCYMLNDILAYRKYTRGWRSMRKDIVLF